MFLTPPSSDLNDALNSMHGQKQCHQRVVRQVAIHTTARALVKNAKAVSRRKIAKSLGLNRKGVSKLLRKSKVFKVVECKQRKDVIDEATISQIQSFYRSNEISKPRPEKKFKGHRLMSSSLMSVYHQYNIKFP